MGTDDLIARARQLELSGQFEPALQLHRRLLEEGSELSAETCARAGELARRLRSPGEAAAFFALASERFEEAGLRNLALALRVRVIRADPSRVHDYRRLSELASALGYPADSRLGCLGYADAAERDGSVDDALSLLQVHLSRFPHDEAVRRRLEEMGGTPAPAAPGVADLLPEEPGAAEFGLLPTLLGPDPAPAAEWTPDSPVAHAAVLETAFAELPPLEGLEPTSAAEWCPPVEADATPGELLPLLDEPAGAPTAAGLPPGAPARPAEDALPLLGLEDALPSLDGLSLLATGAADAGMPEPGAEAGAARVVEAESATEQGALPMLEPSVVGHSEPAPAAPPTVAPPVRVPAPAASTARGDYVDLGELILDDEAEAGTRVRVELEEPSGDEQADFDEILVLFRERVAQTIDPTDSASHYDLGLAFKEMGLLDDAIAQLQRALRGGGPPLATLEVLGECFIQKAEFGLAARLLERAAGTPGAEEHEVMGVLYSLAVCQEALGDVERAQASLERVVAQDIGFRDAVHRLESLRRTEVAAAL